MNSLEEIALKLAKEVEAWVDHEQESALANGSSLRISYWDTFYIEFARRLVAALGVQEPVVWKYIFANNSPVFMEHRKDWIKQKEWKEIPLFAAPVLPSVPEGWQPIETAPKDGTSFLCCSGSWETVACWNKHRDEWCCSAPGYPPYPRDEQPECWRPLPAAPSPQKDAK